MELSTGLLEAVWSSLLVFVPQLKIIFLSKQTANKITRQTTSSSTYVIYCIDECISCYMVDLLTFDFDVTFCIESVLIRPLNDRF